MAGRGLQEVLWIRHATMSTLRSHFNGEDFLEIDPPILIEANAVEAYIDPIFATAHVGTEPIERFLHTSPEIYLKRLLARGAERIYALSHVFRDGERGPLHQPEFLMLEWYRAFGMLEDLIHDCEQIIQKLQHALCKVVGHPVLSERLVPFEVVPMEALWKQYAGVDLRKALVEMRQGDLLALPKRVRLAGYHLREQADFSDAFSHVMLSAIEPAIGKERPCVVTQWPIQMAALAKADPEDPLFAKRFEIYAGGLEIANAFEELQDPVEQRDRFVHDRSLRIQENRSALPIPEAFLTDLHCMPPSVGIALGVDRLIMFLIGSKEIQAVFPDVFAGKEHH